MVKSNTNDKKNKELEQKVAEIKEAFNHMSRIMYGRELGDLSKYEFYETLSTVLRYTISKNWIKTNKLYKENDKKQIYYFSIEFLLGRLLKSNLINLGVMQPVEQALKELGISLDDLINEEPDPGLGNGGLGRLAACFIDSLASLGLPGHGCTIRYQYGLFEQKIINGNQVEIPDNWLKSGYPWEIRKPNKSVDVRIGGHAYMKDLGDGKLELVHTGYNTIMAVPYDVPVVGYKNETVNTLRMWNAEVDRDFSDYGTMSPEQREEHNRYRHNVEEITQFLYPDDSSMEGRRMRLVQEYFFVSAGIQSIVRHYKLTHEDFSDFGNKIGIHINDTHPATAVAELMRILIDEEHLEWDEAWKITTETCAYTNHTILPEALEKWPVDMFKSVLPRIYMIVDEINKRMLEDVREQYPGNEEKVRALSIIQDGQVHMARLAVAGSHSVNGVAQIHTNILKETTLNDAFMYEPWKFNNKTNGITHRRWLIGANPELKTLLDKTISGKWHRKPEQLANLMEYVEKKTFLDALSRVKTARKRILAKYIKDKQGVKIDPKSIFDIQVKRIHSYKRQLMNIMHIMYQYDRLKNDKDYKLSTPVTYFFGGKAAPGYYVAKETIRLINAVADKVNNDPDINGQIKVVFIENFGVSVGELVYPAADVSEQISTASKEASGTGNMKFMMNGALTLGTMDGANVEICDAVGTENCVIFGLRAPEVISYYQNGNYSAWNEYNTNETVRKVMDQMNDGTFGNFSSLYNYIFQSNDEFFILKDFDAYRKAHEEVLARYADKYAWLKTSAINIAKSGIFSSDRTIREYAEDIWHIR